MPFDVTIVGAGPAGSTLARMLGKKLRVLLIERRELFRENGRSPASKCCGGLLAPDAQEMLGRMGLGLPKKVLVDPQLFVVRAVDLQAGLG